ncbi:hypothetical protein GCM10009111_34580 [Colwellia asteriadis]|uniref:DUF1707 domain-containing protein n=1 Tax=Colwellia asteriadis TaxID=517723 RepID=A0ABN1LBF0_9GAMM
MAVILEDRPIETVRSEVIDQLIMNYSHGELSYEAFERRLDKAMELQNNKDLVQLTEDLPLAVDKAFVEGKKQGLAPNYVPGEAEDVDYMIDVFSGSNRRGMWSVAKEIRCLSIFSGTEIDFTDAKFSQREVRVKVFSLFSGIDIHVPENINIVSKAFCIFGAVDNHLSSQSSQGLDIANATNRPTLIIEGFSIFSGIDIKIKRSMKEKLVSLADSLRRLFS